VSGPSRQGGGQYHLRSSAVSQALPQASAAGPVEVVADRRLAQPQAICDNALW
jgi:hypothetical protein